MWYIIDIQEYYSAMRRKEALIHTTVRMDPIMLRKSSQTESHVIPFTEHVGKC